MNQFSEDFPAPPDYQFSKNVEPVNKTILVRYVDYFDLKTDILPRIGEHLVLYVPNTDRTKERARFSGRITDIRWTHHLPDEKNPAYTDCWVEMDLDKPELPKSVDWIVRNHIGSALNVMGWGLAFLAFVVILPRWAPAPGIEWIFLGWLVTGFGTVVAIIKAFRPEGR